MGIAASSALRDENAANGPAYGSLEALGGPKKLKKKPVLVLDPEELEKAHAMFHEASAELLGEEVERAPKPAMILGLAPMEDDDPEELGESDDAESAEDDSQPDAEAVLSLTRRKSVPVVDQSSLGLGDLDMSAEALDHDGYADPEGPVQDDIDLENRIFPSLPIQPELAEDEAAEEALAEEPAPVEEPAPIETDSAPVEAISPIEEQSSAEGFANKHEPEFPVADPVEDYSEPGAPTPSPLFPLEALQARLAARGDAGSAKTEAADLPSTELPTLKPLPEDVETLRERHSKDWYELDKDEVEAREIHAWRDENWREDESVEPPADELSAAETKEDYEPLPEPEPEPEPQPADITPSQPPVEDIAPPPPPAASAPEDDFVFVPATERQAAPDHVHEEQPAEIAQAPEFTTREESVEPAADAAPEVAENVTLTDDDNVDGYAFMRDPRSRRAVITSAPQGRQSALRAKLLREAEEEARREEAAESNSLVIRFWNWLRGLFG